MSPVRTLLFILCICELGQTHVSLLFYFPSFFSPFSLGLEKPAPEGSSRCLTIAPTGYHYSSVRDYGFKDWKGHFSVSSSTSRSSQMSDQAPLFVANSCKITYRCHLHRYAGPLANHNKSNTIHALYGLPNYDYSGSLGRSLCPGASPF